MTKTIFFGAWLAFSGLNYAITYYAPTQEVRQAAELAIESSKPKRQDQFMYAEVLKKLPSCTANAAAAVDGVKYLYCPDKTLITLTDWTRNTKSENPRKGVVTRYYNPEGKLVLIYGHPDDV